MEGLLRFLLLATVLLPMSAAPVTPQAAEFFETKIRPVLAANCYTCHSSANKAVMAGLALDTRAGLAKGSQNGPVVHPGDPDTSPLIRAIRYENRKMPPAGKLPANVIADFEKWVAMGAPDPRGTNAAAYQPTVIDLEKARQFWAFQPPQKPATPRVKNRKWSKSEIDRFILSSLERRKLTPSPDADRATWLRRVTFDLTGLPPTPAELDAFLADRSRTASEKVVDRLLASDRFGERWGRHWLDVARYADSEGRSRNYGFPFAWRYRDYVIDSFNHDKPFDRFIREQLAGDLLPARTPAERNTQTIATGFLTLGAHDLQERDPELFRMDVADEQINATSRAFLGLTVGCARCHDHKFDPISMSDYYAVAGIFKSTEMLSGLQRRPRDNTSYFNPTLFARLSYAPGEAPPPQFTDAAEQQKWESLTSQWEQMQQPPQRRRRTPGAPPPLTGNELREAARKLLVEMDKYPLPSDLVMAVRDSAKPADCELLIKGEVKDPGPKVPRGFVRVIATDPPQIGAQESGRRELAEWIASPRNPLTARVAVNRIWQHMFGRGLVGTVDNFGATGEKPTHPELLDYLATRFVAQSWSVKKMVREIALSRTYRQSTAYNARNAQRDADNRFLWRMNRRRLEVEAIRDSLLMVSGRLEFARPQGSPVLDLPRSSEVTRRRGRPSDYASDLRCRSVYVPVIRNGLSGMYEVFDFPEPSETKGERDVTTVPTQALFLMNSPFVLEQAKAAAARLAKSDATDEARIATMYREVLGRAPNAEECARALDYLRANGDKAWRELYQALFASAEFRYRS